eukprot:2566892-Karenia_brevis.AAC.1
MGFTPDLIKDGNQLKLSVSPDEVQPMVDALGKFFMIEVKESLASMQGGSQSALTPIISQTRELIIVKLVLSDPQDFKADRVAARSFVEVLLGNAVSAHVKKVVPFAKGREMKVFFENMTEQDYTATVQPRLSAKGRVYRLSEEESKSQVAIDKAVKKSKVARKEAIGQLDQASSLVSSLVEMRGQGGNPAKKRRFADRAMTFVATSQRVAAH